MSIVDDFKLDMADDFDIEYAKANRIFSLMISFAVHQAPGRIARQLMVNAFAKAIVSDRTEIVNNFKMVLDNRDIIIEELDEAAADRDMRSANANFKKIEKLVRELSAL